MATLTSSGPRSEPTTAGRAPDLSTQRLTARLTSRWARSFMHSSSAPLVKRQR